MYTGNNIGTNIEPCGTPEVNCLLIKQWSSK